MDLAGIESHYSGQSRETRETPSKCAGCIKCTRQTTSFLLSHIGLLSLVVGYCIMGAFIFEQVELENELMTKRDMKASRLAVSDTIWKITQDMKYLHGEKWKEEVTESLKKFEKSLIIGIKEKGWDGKEDEETVSWSFAGALFYSITVITTIGYGHMAPKTPIGKVVTIVYAVVGIPITVVCWSNIGDAMANAFRICYWKVCCYVYTKKTKKRRKRMLSRHRAMSMRAPPAISAGGTIRSGGGVSGSSRRRSVRSRAQRPSQRSAESRVSSQHSTTTADSKLTTPTIENKLTSSGLVTPSSPVHTKQGLNFDLPNQVPTATDTIKKPAAGQSAAEAVKKTAVQSVAEITAKKTAIQTNNPIGDSSIEVYNNIHDQRNDEPDQKMAAMANLNISEEEGAAADKLNLISQGGVAQPPGRVAANTSSNDTTTIQGAAAASQTGADQIQQQVSCKEDSAGADNCLGQQDDRHEDDNANADTSKEQVRMASSKLSEKAGDRMKGVSSTVLSKIRSAKKSANLALDFEARKLGKSEPSKGNSATNEAVTGSEQLKSLNSRTRAILRAEKDSQKSQNSGSGVSNGSPSQVYAPVMSVARGQLVARLPDEYDDQSYYEEFYYAESEDDLDEVSKRPVPILLSILLVVAYIVGGAFLFQMWEGWAFLDSAYFCFITLTTIGFGDFTPDQKNVDGEQRIALCSIYLLFGIAMIAMCFNLVQVEVINSVKGVGKMLGIIKDSEDDEDY